MTAERKSAPRFLRLLPALIIVTAVLLLLMPSAFACTEVYVGKDASTDGTMIIARSNDHQSVWAARIAVNERVENEPGREMPVSNDGSAAAPVPETTYKYICTPFMSSAQNEYSLQRDAAVCSNEYGVSMTMSVTAFSRKAVLKADPLVPSGITEATANDLIICQSRTAREAVELLCAIIDEYGSSEINIATIADQNEAWYIEMYSGHQYAAVKLPSDAVAVFGNEFCLEYLSEYEDSIVSAQLESLPGENGFAVYGDAGELNLLDTYSGEEVRSDYSHLRTWIGHALLAPNRYANYDINRIYPLTFRAEHPVSLGDVFSILRNRYEGTEYSPDEKGLENIRVIGTDTSMSVHVLKIYPNLPAEMSTVTWVSLGPDVYGTFVPVSNCCTEIAEGFGRDQSVEEGAVFNSNDYAWYNFKAINAIAMSNPSIYGKPVKEYFAKCEEETIRGMESLLKKAAAEYENDPEKAFEMITDYCCMVQSNAFEDSKEILNKQLWTMSLNSNTMKYGTNPETNEILTEKRALTPVKLELDPRRYEYVYEITIEEEPKDKEDSEETEVTEESEAETEEVPGGEAPEKTPLPDGHISL